LFVGLGTVVHAPAARAETAADGVPTDEARARFKEGVRFYDHGKYEQARVAFLQAYALTNHASILMNLAWSCLKSGHPLEAEKYFKKFMSESKDMTDKQIADATEGLNQAQSRLGHLTITAPAGATVLVDGAAVGTAPFAESIELEPGSHKTQVKDGDPGDVQTVRIAVGKTAEVTLRGKPAPPPPARSETARADHDDETDKAPPEATRPVPEPEAAHENHPGPFAVPHNLVPVYILGGLALAGYGTAIGFFVVKQTAISNRAKNEAYINGHLPTGISSFSCDNPPADATLQAECKVINKQNDDIAADAIVANIGLGVGVAATAATVIYWLASSKGPSSPTTGLVLTPLLGSNAGGLSLSGEF
jgi:hypothetical protein